MKIASLAMAAAALVLSGCDGSSLVSLEPFTAAQDATFDVRLLGTWSDGDAHDAGLCIIRRDGEAGYRIRYVDGSTVKEFNALLFQVGGAQVLDLSPAEDDGFSVPVHAALRVWVDAAQFRWAYLDSEWLRAQAEPLGPRPAGKRTLLAAPGAAVHSFLLKYGADEKAFGEVMTFSRVP